MHQLIIHLDVLFIGNGSRDYTPENNGSVIADFTMSVEISVAITNDFDFENDETFFVNLTGCSPGCVISSNQSVITITIQSDESK